MSACSKLEVSVGMLKLTHFPHAWFVHMHTVWERDISGCSISDFEVYNPLWSWHFVWFAAYKACFTLRFPTGSNRQKCRTAQYLAHKYHSESFVLIIVLFRHATFEQWLDPNCDSGSCSKYQDAYTVSCKYKHKHPVCKENNIREIWRAAPLWTEFFNWSYECCKVTLVMGTVCCAI